MVMGLSMREVVRTHRAKTWAELTWWVHPLRMIVPWLLAAGAVAGVWWVVAQVEWSAPSRPDWSLPDLPAVPWLTVGWVVGVLALTGLGVWLWRHRYGYMVYRVPWRYRLRRMFRRY